MRLLVDAHALLWWLTGSSALSARAQQAIVDPGNDLVVGIGTLWELTIRRSLGKLNFPYDLETVVRDEGFAISGVTLAHLRTLETLPFHHRDPFDRLLLAQSLTDHIPIVSGDREFSAYGVSLIW